MIVELKQSILLILVPVALIGLAILTTQEKLPPRTPNPPQANISYPQDGQTITLTSSQTFCIVDVPSGGDQTGLQRKHNINSSGFIDYQGLSTLCYDPPAGENTISLQYKNAFGEESSVYSKSFSIVKE